MEKLRKGLARYAGDLVLVAGAAAITVGAGMIYLPAGLIAGGVLAIAGVILNSLGPGLLGVQRRSGSPGDLCPETECRGPLHEHPGRVHV